jgi:hypothetical protein
MTRDEELAANLAGVRARIAAAAAGAGRAPRDIQLVAVSKTFPVSDVEFLRAQGQRDFGENKHQDAALKAAAVPAVCWHFLGQLQRNKATAVGQYADVVHSVDRVGLLGPLMRAVETRGRPLTALVQVDLDGSRPGRGGAQPAEVPPLADAIAATPGLVLGGVMAIAPRDQDPRAAFARLRDVADRIQRDHPGARTISAGMSGDLEAAVAEGATLVRVGTALFGGREPRLG